ncbi:MAG: 4-hydroxybenzoate octaprenyltransferase [Candidatus Comchoanobacterales bacterium]
MHQELKTSYSFKIMWQLCRLHQPRGILLLCWPVWTALWITQANTFLWVVMTLGAAAMRTLGCLINDYCDQDIDGHVWRTQQRPLATGQASVRMWLFAVMVSSLIALGCLLALPKVCWYWSLVIIPWVMIYPTAKRWCPLPQVILACVFSSGIPMVFLASVGVLNAACWLLTMIHVFWIFAYDTQYALADLKDDMGLSIFSSAKTLGVYTQSAINGCYAMVIIFSLLLSWYLGVHWLQGPMLVILALGFYRTHKLTCDGDERKALKAFLWNNHLNAWLFFMWVLTV